MALRWNKRNLDLTGYVEFSQKGPKYEACANRSKRLPTHRSHVEPEACYVAVADLVIFAFESEISGTEQNP